MTKKDGYSQVSAGVLRKLNKGDKEAFDEVYSACHRRIYGNLLKLVKSEETAREILQKVFIRLWEKREIIDPEQPVHAWLHRVAANMAIDFFRKAARDRKLKTHLIITAEKKYSHVEEDLNQKQMQSILNEAVDKLSPRRKEIFKLIKMDGKSYKQVSQMLGISVSTINDHIVKANHNIREQMGRMGINSIFLLLAAYQLLTV